MDSANTRKDGGVGGKIPPRGRRAEEPDAGEGNTAVDDPNKDKESVGKDSQADGWQVYTRKSRRRRAGRASLKPWGSSVSSPRAGWSSGKDCAPLEPWGSSISSPKAGSSSGKKDCSPLEPWGSSISSPNAGWSSGKKDCAPLEPWGSSISSPKAGWSSGKDCAPSNPWESSISSPKAGSSSGKDCAPLEPWGSSISSPNAGWSCGNNSLQNNKNRPLGRGNSKQKPWHMASAPVIPPPLPHGWQCATRFGPSSSQSKVEEDCHVEVADEKEEEEEEIVDDSDDDLTSDYDTDASQRGHETRRKNKWLQKFFGEMDDLTAEEISDPTRDGSVLHATMFLVPSAVTRACSVSGASAAPAGEVFGKWQGPKNMTIDHEIVWPPMVIVMNTRLDHDENEKWIGMGNQELRDCFSSYDVVKARHSYGPEGHRGMSVLIFEATATGYLEAERLHKHFAEQGTDRDAWAHPCPRLFCAGGKRQLYGYLARKEDMDSFNRHCHGRSRLKYEMRSYQEKVVIPTKQMREDAKQLPRLEKKVMRRERQSQTLEQTLDDVTQLLHQAMEENSAVKLRAKLQHEEHKAQMDNQERFLKEQMDKIHKMTKEKERNFEQQLQEERAKAKDSDQRLRNEEIERFINSQVKDVEKFEADREKLMRAHEQKKLELKKRRQAEKVELAKKLDAALTKLMEKYTPAGFHASSTSSS
ncbi:hypothetical protein C4D60_Mb03t18340 [Musa balbisiana]|uniref:XS domain-containing protein n=1 Tax=Musa balbisiana TaxID=52838 RepID=A0A4S8JAQ9_MUSBA|nr:hypothetical protein C4D60_Mb03t18340 [Musa balbisiana]